MSRSIEYSAVVNPLGRFFQDAFSEEELERFVKTLLQPAIQADFAREGSLASQAQNLAGLLRRRGDINDELFDALINMRPSRGDEIEALRAMVHRVKGTSPPPEPERAPPPKAKSSSLSEYLSETLVPARFESWIRGVPGAADALAPLADTAVKVIPVLYYEAVVKLLWRGDLLTPEFFRDLVNAYSEPPSDESPLRSQTIEEATNALESIAKSYARAARGTKHIRDDDEAGFLDRMLQVPEFGLVLKPSDFGEQEAFHTELGTLLEFVTIWELYDEPGELDTCVRALVELARRLFKHAAFSSLVTCTATGRHLVEYIHAHIEDSDASSVTSGSVIAAHYLTPEMTLDIESGAAPDFRNQRLLIVTDVVASKGLVRQLAAAVRRFGGTVVGAIAAIFVGDETVTVQEPLTLKRTRERFRVVEVDVGAGYDFKIQTLAHYPITVEPKGTYDSDELLSIDPSTILPGQVEHLRRNSQPLFESLGEMISTLDKAKALRFGLFRSHGRVVTAAMRFTRIWEGDLAGQVGERIKRHFDAPDDASEGAGSSVTSDLARLRVVTTHREDDVKFADFVQGILRVSDAQRVHLPRREGSRSPNPFVVMNQKVDRIKGCNVLLVLAAIDSSDHLRAIISLLLSVGAHSVEVLCLLSRMRFYSTNFISRIHGMDAKGGELRVRFKAVFELPELEHTVLERMIRTIDQIATDYRASPAASGLTHLADNEFKHFKPLHLKSYRFESTAPHLLEDKLIGTEPPVEVVLGRKLKNAKELSTVDGMLFAVTRRLTAVRSSPGESDFTIKKRRSPQRVIDLLANRYKDASRQARPLKLSKRRLYQLFALLLCDLSYLKKNRSKRLSSFRKALGDAWCYHHRRRPKAETAKQRATHVEVEARYLFLIAVLGAIDEYSPEGDQFYRAVFHEAISDLTAADGTIAPDVIDYLNDERLVLALSMLFHLRFSARYRVGVTPDARALDADDALSERGASLAEAEAPIGSSEPRASFEEWSCGDEGPSSSAKEPLPASDDEMLERAKKTLRSARETIQRALEAQGEPDKALLSAKARVDTIRYDLGEFRKPLRARVIRHIQATLYGTKNERIGDLQQIVEKLESLCEVHENAGYAKLRSEALTSQFKDALEHGLLACGDLERLAANIRDLCLFAGSRVAEPPRFEPFVKERSELALRMARPRELDLRTAVRSLSERIYTIRQRGQMVLTHEELQELKDLSTRIKRLLGDHALRELLADFVVELGVELGDYEGVDALHRLYVLGDSVLLFHVIEAARAVNVSGQRRVTLTMSIRDPDGVNPDRDAGEPYDPKVVANVERARWARVQIVTAPEERHVIRRSPVARLDGVKWTKHLPEYANKLKAYDGRVELLWGDLEPAPANNAVAADASPAKVMSPREPAESMLIGLQLTLRTRTPELKEALTGATP